ncbi:MAG: DMT family transporter [Rhodobacteraceae bacterium]|nr:DMT family transporter [Paracoccaceae bacterium]
MNNLRGMLIMTLSMLGFAIEDTFIKFLAGALSPGVVVSCIAFGGTLVFCAVAMIQGVPIMTRAFLHPVIIVRNVAEVVGATAFIAALALIPLGVASAILMAIPLIVTMAAALFLGETVGIRRWLAILVGFAGVLLIFRPGTEAFDPNALFALAAAVALSIRDLCARMIPPGVRQMQLGIWGFAMFFVSGLILLAIWGGSAVPDPAQAGILAVAIVTGVLAYYAINLAMKLGDVAVVSPFRYTRLIFGLILGIWIFGERPDLATLAGASLILASGIYTFMREQKLAQAQA